MEHPVAPPGAARPPVTQSYLPEIKSAEGPEGIILGDQAGRGQALSLGCFAAIWIPVSCFVSAMLLVGVLAEGPSAGPRLLMLLFPIPFLLVSLWLVWQFIRRGLIARKMAPPTLTVRRWPLYLGATSELIYRRTLRGANEVESLSATLRCTEWVRYRVGTDTHTATHTVWKEELPPATVVPSVEQVEGRWRIAIPRELPASFVAPANELRWVVDVTLRAGGVPDDTTSFTLLVRPEVAP